MSKSDTTKTTPSKTRSKRKADYYNSPDFNYMRYWDGREYENAAERLAIKRLLAGKHFRHAADIGGGYGRLCVFLENYADKVTLAEPSQQQLDLAEDFLKDHPEIDRKLTQADKLDLPDNSCDLLTMIRVMHHLPDPSAEFAELHRVLADDGYIILEVANYWHARNRVKALMKHEKLPTTPVDIRSEANKHNGTIEFVNHDPHTVRRQLADAGLKVERVLSVSNLRSPALKKIMPRSVMLAIEGVLQPTLARTYFGPSVFFLVRKTK